LRRQNYIAYRHNAQTLKNWFKHHFGKYNVNLNVVLTVGSHQAVIAAINHHVGLGVVASHMVNENLNSGQVVRIESSKAQIINQISLVHLQNKIPTHTEKVFEKFLVGKIHLMEI
jgi:DNA-binding transcriptional LysR family regulator